MHFNALLIKPQFFLSAIVTWYHATVVIVLTVPWTYSTAKIT